MKVYIIVCVSMAVVAIGCKSNPHAQGRVESARLSKEPKLAPPPQDFKPFHARPIPDLHVVGVPDTARTYAPFKRVKADMPLAEAIKLCGLPDGDYGSIGGRTGHVLIWDLKDGSWVSIRSDDLEVVEEITHEYPIQLKQRCSP